MHSDKADAAGGESAGDRRCVIVGAGPAGLSAAYELLQHGYPAVVLEADHQVGGISRTVEYKGFRFDIGGHRFFSKVEFVREWWHRMLPDDFLVRPRLSRILYNNRFFAYPLKPLNALRNLGVLESARVVISFVRARLFPEREEKSFEQWVSNRFGRRLYEIFFKTYTEKVWGIPCSEIGADWAAQRIKNLDLLTVVRTAFVGNRWSGGKVYTSLIEEFHYPRLGPGMMWERAAAAIAELGCPVELGKRVVAVEHSGGRVRAVLAQTDQGVQRVVGTDFISSMALRDLLNTLDPAPPPNVLKAANELRYRDFLSVGLILDCTDPFPDNWIYIHSAQVRVGRIQNYKAWSPAMVSDAALSCIGLEYFVQENDDLWSMPDDDLIAFGARECVSLGLIRARDVIDGMVIRMPKAYPVYDRSYQERLGVIRDFLANLTNLQVVGRNGQHRYNNQDHSMVTAIYAARNVLGGSYDVWNVNVDREYLEEENPAVDLAKISGDRLVPQPLLHNRAARVLRQAFARYDPVALGMALGIPSAGGLFIATAVLLIEGGFPVGPNLALLSNYIIGFRVSWEGAFIGFLGAGLLGFGFGWTMAKLINAVVGWHERTLGKRLEHHLILEAVDQDVTEMNQ